MLRSLIWAAGAAMTFAGIAVFAPASRAQSPAAQQCILGKMTAYVRDRDLKGLDSRIPEAKSAEFRAQCGEPEDTSAQAVPPSGAAAPPAFQSAAAVRADRSFNVGCQSYTLDRREVFPIGRPRACPGRGDCSHSDSATS